MADYDLTGLSTRSFEQLIQAIAAKVIGPGIVIFGDGPDGGREATFEGSVPYRDPEHRWKGYGVVQAKFRKRLQGSTRDGKWALDQLRSELEKFTDPERDLRKPEYYIFATNVVLTPVQDQGSKDKAYALIEGFQDELPLKDFDFWDYDKICKFIDDSEDIRRSYAAWITPGDVLARVIEWVEFQQPDFEDVITNFLQKELVADQYANLEQAGHAAQDRIPLAKVFVDLPTFDERRLEPPEGESSAEDLQPGFVTEVLDAAMERLDPESLTGQAGYRGGTLENSRPRPGRFVLIGGPGQGKTTIGQFICQLFRTSILRKKGQPFTPEVDMALDLIETQCCSEGIQLPSAPRFPMRVALSDFASKLASDEWNQVNSLLSYMAHRIRKITDRQVSVEDFRRWLGAYPWIIILDGLDEVPVSSNRDAVLAAVNDFWIDATERSADVLIFATTRPQGYNEDYSPDLYHHKWLAPLSNARAIHYGRRLAQLRYGNDQDRCYRVINRLERASSHEATSRLMRSPLQVTIMATLVDRIGQPPQERWRLFKEYYNVIYQREMERDIPAAAILRNHKPDIDAIHSSVGLLLQVESDRPGRTEARFSSDRFADVVEGRLVEEGHQGDRLGDLKREIIEAATQRLVFLVGLEADRVGFEIRSLQEFMASEGLMDGDDQRVRERLREIAPISSWRNVFLFAAGKCFAERQYLRDTIHTICAEMNENNGIFHTTLAGSQLALDLLEDGPARRQPKYSECLARLALSLLDLPPEEYNARLADVYDPSLKQVYREEIEERLIQSTLQNRLASFVALLRLLENGVPWAEDLMEVHWPGEEEQKRQLLLAAGHRVSTCLNLPQLTEVIPSLAPWKLTVPWPLPIEGLPGPSWYRAAARIIHGLRRLGSVSLYLPNIGENVLLNFPTSLRETRELHESWMALLDTPNPGRSWIPLVAGARFIKNPDKFTLAQGLRTIADNLAPWPSSLLPWPIAACLDSSSSQEELLDLARKAETGDLGDTDDWRSAEDRWLTEGVTQEDIAYMTDECWPFDKWIAERGFPFAVSGGLAFDIAHAEEVLGGLVEMHAETAAAKMRSTVACWVLSCLRDLYDESKITSQKLRYSRLRELVHDASDRGLSLSALGAFKWEGPISEEGVEFFHELGGYGSLYGPYFRSMPPLVELLSEAFRDHPKRFGILRVISHLSARGCRPTVPLHLLDPELYDDPMFREAAIIVRLSEDRWTQNEATQLAGYVSELSEDRPGIYTSVLKAINKHRPVGPSVDRFLLELYEQLPATEWETAGRIIQVLNDSLRYRTSGLGDSCVWSELGLPDSLGMLIQS